MMPSGAGAPLVCRSVVLSCLGRPYRRSPELTLFLEEGSTERSKSRRFRALICLSGVGHGGQVTGDSPALRPMTR